MIQPFTGDYTRCNERVLHTNHKLVDTATKTQKSHRKFSTDIQWALRGSPVLRHMY